MVKWIQRLHVWWVSPHLPHTGKAASNAYFWHVVSFQRERINVPVHRDLLLTAERKRRQKTPLLTMDAINLRVRLSDLLVLFALYSLIRGFYIYMPVDQVIENKFAVSQTIKFPFS